MLLLSGARVECALALCQQFKSFAPPKTKKKNEQQRNIRGPHHLFFSRSLSTQFVLTMNSMIVRVLTFMTVGPILNIIYRTSLMRVLCIL